MTLNKRARLPGLKCRDWERNIRAGTVSSKNIVVTLMSQNIYNTWLKYTAGWCSPVLPQSLKIKTNVRSKFLVPPPPWRTSKELRVGLCEDFKLGLWRHRLVTVSSPSWSWSWTVFTQFFSSFALFRLPYLTTFELHIYNSFSIFFALKLHSSSPV